MIDGYEKHTCTECETMFISNEELHQHHIIDHGVALTESTVEWSDITPEDQVREADDGSFTSNGKPITFSDEDSKQAKEYLSETAQLQKVMVASEQRLKIARDQIRATNLDTDEFYDQILGESNGQDFSSGAGTINPLDTPKFKYSKNKKLADTINTKGYNPNPNAGLYDNKQFKEGGVHLEDPLAKEDFEVSFYGGEAKASEDYGDWNNVNTPNLHSGSFNSLLREIGEYDRWATMTENEKIYIFKFSDKVDDGQATVSDYKPYSFESKVKAREWELPAELQGLIPNSGSVNDPDLEELRKAMNTYYEVSNNGGGNWYQGADGDSKSLMMNYNLSDTERLEAFHVDNNENQYDGYGNDLEIDTDEETRLMNASLAELEPLINQLIESAKGKINQNNWNLYESKASEDQHTDSWDEKYGQDLCPICKDSGNCNSMVFHAKLWNDVKEKSDESLKADWDDSVYEEKYTWLKDLGVDDAFKYSNMTLYELPEEVWQKVNEDYVQGFKQMTGESYKPDQQNAVETVEDKIISRKLDGTPVGQIARELVLWNNFSEENATKIVGEVEPSDNDMVANTLFNKRYSECNESEIQEMELYDA
jgi:hypothetical protein